MHFGRVRLLVSSFAVPRRFNTSGGTTELLTVLLLAALVARALVLVGLLKILSKLRLSTQSIILRRDRWRDCEAR